MRARAAVTAVLVLAGLSAGTHVLTAQAAAPEAVLSFGGGFSLARALWHLPAQPVLADVRPLATDTFDLARRLEPGPLAWIGVTRFARPWLGVGVEGSWITSPTTTSCRMRGPIAPDPLGVNVQICDVIDGLRRSSGALSLQGTVTVRASPRRRVSPFARAGGGFALLGSDVIDTRVELLAGRCPGCTVTILEGPLRQLTWAATLAAGVTLGTGSGGRFRIEARDAVLGLPVVTGPAAPMAVHPVPSTRVRAIHRLALTLGFDVPLGGRHRRRY